MFNAISSSKFRPTDGGRADATSLLSIHFMHFVQNVKSASCSSCVYVCMLEIFLVCLVPCLTVITWYLLLHALWTWTRKTSWQLQHIKQGVVLEPHLFAITNTHMTSTFIFRAVASRGITKLWTPSMIILRAQFPFYHSQATVLFGRRTSMMSDDLFSAIVFFVVVRIHISFWQSLLQASLSVGPP